MVTIKVFLDKRKIRKDNTFPVCLRIYHNGSSTTRSARIDVLESQWDDVKKLVKKNHPTALAYNRLLTKQIADLQSTLLLADAQKVKEYLQPAKIKQIPVEVKKTVFEFTNELIVELRLDNKIGNAWVYESTLNALRKFHRDTNLYFEQIDFQFLDKYNKHLLRSGVRHNTAFFYMRTLRAFYNKAIKHKIVDRNLYPFHDISLKAEKTKKRAIDKLLAFSTIGDFVSAVREETKYSFPKLK